MADLKTNCILYYAFDNQANPLAPTIAGTPPMIVGSGTIGTTSAGRVGAAIKVDNARVDISDIDLLSFAPGAPFSFNFWAQFLGNNGASKCFFEKDTTTGSVDCEYRVYQSGTTMTFIISDPTEANKWTCSATVPTLTDSLYHMLTVTYDGNATLKIYIDGVDKTTSVVQTGTYTGMTNGPGIFTFNKVSTTPRPLSYLDEFSVYNAELTQANINTLYNSGKGFNQFAPLVTTIRDNWLSWWSFDGPTGFDDDSLNSHFLTLQIGTKTVISTAGRPNKYYSFDGATQLSTADSDAYTFGSDFAFSFWMDYYETTFPTFIVSKRNDGIATPNYEWQITHPANNQIRFTMYDGTNSEIYTASFTMTGWHHYVFSYNFTARVMTLYVDTVPVTLTMTGTLITAFTNTNAAVFFGAFRSTSAANFTRNHFDSFGIRAAQISQADAITLYNNGLGLNPFTNALTDGWEFWIGFDEGKIDPCTDYTGKGRNLANPSAAGGQVTVPVSGGKPGGYGNFTTATNTRVSLSNTSTLYFGTGAGGTDSPVVLHLWLRVPSTPSVVGTPIGKQISDTPLSEWNTTLGTGLAFTWNLFSNNAGTAYIRAQIPGTSITLAAWYHIVLGYTGNKATSGFYGWLNGVPLVSGSTLLLSSAGSYTGLMASVTQNIYVGMRRQSGGVDQQLSAAVDNIAMRRGFITQAEVTALYNNGQGLNPFKRSGAILLNGYGYSY